MAAVYVITKPFVERGKYYPAGTVVQPATPIVLQRWLEQGKISLVPTTTGAAPTAAAGANAGTSPPAPVVNAGSTDYRGSLTCGTGTTPAAGSLAVVTFSVTRGSAPFVTLTPGNAATAALNDYVVSTTTTGFTIGVQGAPAASQANTVYSFYWTAVL